SICPTRRARLRRAEARTGDWGLGIGDWGARDWVVGECGPPTNHPNPQSPIPNPLLDALFGPRGGEHVADDFVVSLVARVFVEPLAAALQTDHGRPRPGPHRRIVDGDRVVDPVRRSARQAFDDVEMV